MHERKTVYGAFTQEELDWQYNNRERVPECTDLMAAYKARGDVFAGSAPKHVDIPFGDSPAEVLDVFPATGGDGPAPVMLYFHGGYWSSRHKDDFSFIAEGFAPAGAMVIVVNYALIPDVDMAELVRQCRASVAWAYKNAAKYGGDPSQLFITGHSAGAHVTAMLFATDWREWGVPCAAIRGGFALSGLYDLEPIRLNYMNATLGFTDETVAKFSPVHLQPTVNAPLVLAVGGNETPEFIRHNGMLPMSWGTTGLTFEEYVVPGLNHFTILEDFSTAGRTLNTHARQMLGL